MSFCCFEYLPSQILSNYFVCFNSRLTYSVTYLFSCFNSLICNLISCVRNMYHCFTFTVFPNLFVGFWLRIFNFNLSGCIERNLAWFLQCNTIYKYLWTWSNSFFPDHMYHQSIQFIVFITLPEYFSLSAFVLSSLKTLNIVVSHY